MKLLRILFAIFIVLLNSCKKENRLELPVIYTKAPTEITYTTSISGGTVADDGGTPIIVKGVCWNTSPEPTVANYKTDNGEGKGASNSYGVYTSYITDLSPNTTYYLKAYATNKVGTSYGVQVTFTTNKILVPNLTTIAVTSISDTTAISGGNITSDNGGFIVERGVCWGLTNTPTIADNKTSDGNNSGSFSSNITGLNPNTPYYVRAYATNSAGTNYGNAISFKTISHKIIIFNPNIVYGSLTDIDNNTYKVVTIGTQTWMAENLRTTKYNDGAAIPMVTDGKTWAYLSTPAYSWYNNDANQYKNIYGALYNYYVVNTNKLCPSGWHISSNPEWVTLINYLGGLSLAGGKMKETGTNHWNYPNTNATNESGFTALPGGGRSIYFVTTDLNDHYGESVNINSDALWWTNTNGIYQNLKSDTESISYADGAANGVGFSVRCIKD